MLAHKVELKIKPKRGKPRVVEATPETLEVALSDVGPRATFISLEDREGCFMRIDEDGELDFGETTPSGLRSLHRADAGSVRALGARPALLGFLNGDDDWRDEYLWDDVSFEVRSVIPWPTYILIVLLLVLFGVVWLQVKDLLIPY